MSIIALLSYILQATLFDFIQIYGIKPNLLIVTIIAFALIRGKEEGAIYGLMSGLLFDIMAGKAIGLFAILGMYLGIIIGMLNKNIYKENYLIPALITAGGTFVYELLFYLFSFFSVTQDQFLWFIIGYIVPETIYNTLISIFIYFVILYINKKLDYYKKTARTY